ncbi:type VI secretion system protein ImpJ [Luteibacter sp. Sphag1AF]|uniref:type VI secretion system baseplate subunit TssK n=1 Tax=Luteibacter sp. Sphag1AF TaxID=2587031 RepID=UPI001620DBC6|nr:type VI secretion system baseplate subunit TssK [Luteibacter sp. Sphag1AF]MBB3228074.1 type VI secretion system protein ImpJ [Luteibacter sp. Sphag1AF]
MSAVVDTTPMLPEAVSWSEGMLLSPQHFQQNDIFWNQLLQQRLALLQPYGWGVLDMALDATELSKGRVQLSRLRCVMPDGLLIDYPGYFESFDLMLDLKDHDWSSQPEVVVHVRVPVRGKGAASSVGDMQRYTIERGAPESDENTGKDDIIVDRMRPCMSLVAGATVARSYCSFPLLRLFGDSLGVHLAPFHPPMLRTDASGFLGQSALQRQLSLLSDALWQKYRELLGVRVDDRGQSRYDGEASVQIQAARYLVMGLPTFDALLHAGTTHPWQMYLALSQLVGFVAATAGARQPPAMKGYDHNDCLPQFQQAISYIREQLAHLNADYRVLDFRRVGASGFHCDLPAGIATDNLLIEVTPRQGQLPAKLNEWMTSARIGSESLIYTLVRQRMTGASIHAATPAQVTALNLRAGAFVYELSNGSMQTAAGTNRHFISDGQTLVILGEPDSDVPSAITLYLPREAAR